MATQYNSYEDYVITNVNAENKSFDINKACTMCGQSGHNFVNCSVLNNVKHFRQSYITLKLMLNRNTLSNSNCYKRKDHKGTYFGISISR